jgi:hypothetical protein
LGSFAFKSGKCPRNLYHILYKITIKQITAKNGKLMYLAIFMTRKGVFLNNPFPLAIKSFILRRGGLLNYGQNYRRIWILFKVTSIRKLEFKSHPQRVYQVG